EAGVLFSGGTIRTAFFPNGGLLTGVRATLLRSRQSKPICPVRQQDACLMRRPRGRPYALLRTSYGIRSHRCADHPARPRRGGREPPVVRRRGRRGGGRLNRLPCALMNDSPGG